MLTIGGKTGLSDLARWWRYDLCIHQITEAQSSEPETMPQFILYHNGG